MNVGRCLWTSQWYNIANTGTDTIPTPDIAEGNDFAIMKIKQKKAAILISPSFSKLGKSLPLGSEGFKANNSSPAGNALSAPSKRGGQSAKVYWVTAYVVPQKKAGIIASSIFMIIYLYVKILSEMYAFSVLL